MSGRKNVLTPFQIFNAVSMRQDQTSTPTNIQFLDNTAIQLMFTSGNPTGTFYVQGSLDYNMNLVTGQVTNNGTWTSLSFSTPPSASGSADSILIDMNQLSFPFIRVKFVNTYQETGSITTVADSSGSLNNTYFLVNTADAHKYCFWINVNGAGTPPVVAGYTNEVVAVATNAANTAVATALGTAMAVTGITSIVVNSNVVTYKNSVAGAASIAQGTPTTGFTLASTSVTATLTGYISVKMV